MTPVPMFEGFREDIALLHGVVSAMQKDIKELFLATRGAKREGGRPPQNLEGIKDQVAALEKGMEEMKDRNNRLVSAFDQLDARIAKVIRELDERLTDEDLEHEKRLDVQARNYTNVLQMMASQKEQMDAMEKKLAEKKQEPENGILPVGDYLKKMAKSLTGKEGDCEISMENGRLKITV